MYRTITGGYNCTCERRRLGCPKAPTGPQPERGEPQLADPRLRDLTFRDWKAILLRSAKQANDDKITDVAAALAYYAFLAIPAALLIAVGVFSRTAGPDTIESMMDRLSGVVPAEAIQLIEESLTRVTENKSGGLVLIVLGFLLALWTTTGAMNALMRGLNRVYGRKETRSFVKQRLTALTILVCLLLAFALSFGLLVMGPVISEDGRSARPRGRVRLDLVDGRVADPRPRAPLRLRRRPLSRPERRPPTLAVPHARLGRRRRGLAGRLRPLRRLREPLRLLQQGVGLARGGDHPPHLALALRARAAPGAEINAEAERSRELRQGQPAELELQAPAKA